MPESGNARPLTAKRLTNIALYYLGRYESSVEQLRKILLRRVLKEKMKGADIRADAEAVVESILSKMIADGYVDDRRFAQGVVRKCQSAGKSRRFLIGKLKTAGIDSDLICELTADLTDSDLEAARRFVQKKKIGRYRPLEKQKECFKKDLAAMARAGFSFDVAKQALETDEDGDFYYE